MARNLSIIMLSQWMSLAQHAADSSCSSCCLKAATQKLAGEEELQKSGEQASAEVQAELVTYLEKRKNAETLRHALSKKAEAWADSARSLREGRGLPVSVNMGDAFVSAAVLTYGGPFPLPYRYASFLQAVYDFIFNFYFLNRLSIIF